MYFYIICMICRIYKIHKKVYMYNINNNIHINTSNINLGYLLSKIFFKNPQIPHKFFFIKSIYIN